MSDQLTTDIAAQLLRGEPLDKPLLQAAGATIGVLRADAVRLHQFIEHAAEQCNCADIIVDLRAALAGEWLYQQLPGWDPNNPTVRPTENSNDR